MPKFWSLLWRPLGLIGIGVLLFGLPQLFPTIWLAAFLPWIGGISILLGVVRFFMGKN